MVLKTSKNKICMHQVAEKIQDKIVTEGDMIVNDVKPDILNIISADGLVSVYKKEIADGKIRLDGNINAYIIYLANDENGSNRTLNTVLNFTYITEIKNCKEQMTFYENIELDKIECKILNERKINIKAILNIDGVIYFDEDVNIISSVEDKEDIKVLSSQKTVNSLMGKAETSVYVKETIKINSEESLAEIMNAKVNIIDKSIKISYNKILAKADLAINIIYLTEDNRIYTTNAKIPIMGFVDMENISEENKCDVDYKIKNIIIKPNSNEDNSVYVEAEIQVTCLAYEQKEIMLIEDMYSIYSNLEFKQKKIDIAIVKKNIIENCTVNRQITIPEIENCKMYNMEIVSKINNYNVRNSKILYEMELNLKILYGADNFLATKNIVLPFSFEINSEFINENDNIKTFLNVINKEIDVSGTNVNLNVDIEFLVEMNDNETLNIIDDITIEDLRDENAYSMVIYFVKKGDTLWKIAKKFKSTIEDIAKVNEIEDIDKINVGQQLYIPKYVKKSIA